MIGGINLNSTSKRVVLITGSSRGIGKAIAEEFAKLGDNIVINYIVSDNEAGRVKKELEKKYGVSVLCIRADVTKEDEVSEMVDCIIDTYGRIDVLVNNAGIAIDKEFDDRTIKDWKDTLTTNLIGPFIVSRCCGRYMLKRGER